MHTCRRCGTPNRPGRNHCIACGEPLEGPAQPPGQTLPGPSGPASGGADQAPPELSLPSRRGRTLLGIPQRTPGAPLPPAPPPPDPPPDLSSPRPASAPPASAPPASAPPAADASDAGSSNVESPTPSASAQDGSLDPVPPVAEPSAAASSPNTPGEAAPSGPALEPLAPAIQPLPPDPGGGTTEPAPTEAFFPPPRPGQQRTSLIPARAAPGAVEPTIPPDSSRAPQAESPAGPRRPRRWPLFAAAIVLLVGGAGAGLAIWGARSPSSAPAPPLPFRTEVLVDVAPDATQSPVVDVLTPPGSRVRVDGAALDAVESPSAAQAVRTRHRLEPPEEALGEAADVEVTQSTVSIEVELPSGETASTDLVVRLPVSPLQLTAPGPRWVLDPGLLLVRGTTSPGARVQCADSRVRADSHGNFLLPVPTTGTGVLTVSSSAPGQITRRVQVHVLDRAALPPPTAFTELAAGADARRVRITGKVAAAHQEAEGVLLVLDVTHGCTKAPCRVEVLHPVRLDPARLQGTRPRAQGPSYGPGQRLDVVGEVVRGGARPRLRAEALVPR